MTLVRAEGQEPAKTGHGLAVKAGIISLGKALVKLSGLASAAVLSRYLSKDSYGTYKQVFLVYNTLIPLLVLGLPMSINYFVPQIKHPEKQKAFVLQTYTVLVLMGAVFSITLFFGAPFIAVWFGNPSLATLLRIFALIPVLALPTRFYQNLFICLDKARLSAGLSVGLAICRVASAIIPILLGYPLETLFMSLAVFFMFQLAIVSFFVFRPFGTIKTVWSKALISKQFKYAIPLAVNSIVGIVTYQIDKIMVSSFFTVSQYAIYANGAIQIPLVGIITGAVMAVLIPEFVKLYHDSKRTDVLRLWHSSIRKTALIILPTMFFLLLYAPEFLSVLFSPKYIQSAVYFRIYLLALPLRITIFSGMLLAMGLSSVILRYTLVTFVVNVVLNYILVKTIGLPGPAVATVIALYVLAFLQLRRISRELGVSMLSIFPWRILAAIVGVSALCGGGTLLFSRLVFFENWFWQLLAGVGVYWILFLVIGGLTRVVTARDLRIPLDILKGVIRR